MWCLCTSFGFSSRFGCAIVPVSHSFDAALLKVAKNHARAISRASRTVLEPAVLAVLCRNLPKSETCGCLRQPRGPAIPWKLPLHFQTPGSCPSDSVAFCQGRQCHAQKVKTERLKTGGCRDSTLRCGCIPPDLPLYAVRTIGNAVYHNGLYDFVWNSHDSRLFTEHPAARCQGVVVGLALVQQPGCLQPRARHVPSKSAFAALGALGLWDLWVHSPLIYILFVIGKAPDRLWPFRIAGLMKGSHEPWKCGNPVHALIFRRKAWIPLKPNPSFQSVLCIEHDLVWNFHAYVVQHVQLWWPRTSGHRRRRSRPQNFATNKLQFG